MRSGDLSEYVSFSLLCRQPGRPLTHPRERFAKSGLIPPFHNVAHALLYSRAEIESILTPRRKWRGHPSKARPPLHPGEVKSLPRLAFLRATAHALRASAM